MTNGTVTGPALATLRSGSWLLPRRLAVYPLLLLAVAAGIVTAWVLASDGLVDPLGKPLGSDFLGFWAASKVALGQGGAAVYDIAALQAAETAALARPVPFFTWLYPPTTLLLVWPLALLPYLPSLLLWTIGQLVLALAVLRRILPHPLALRLAVAFPATFLCLIHGQNALLSTGLLGGGLLLLRNRPAAAGALFAALLYKPHLGLLIPVALIAGGYWRALLGGAAAGVLLLALTLVWPGVAAWMAFLGHGDFAQSVLEQGWVDWGKMASTYAGLRLLGFPSGLAWAGQGLIALAAGVAVALLWHGDRPFAHKAAGLAAGTLLATPFLLDYDLMILALPIAWLAGEGLRRGFRPWEATLLAVAWASPVLVRLLGLHLELPSAPLVAGAMLWLAATGERTGASRAGG